MPSNMQSKQASRSGERAMLHIQSVLSLHIWTTRDKPPMRVQWKKIFNIRTVCALCIDEHEEIHCRKERGRESDEMSYFTNKRQD